MMLSRLYLCGGPGYAKMLMTRFTRTSFPLPGKPTPVEAMNGEKKP